MPYLEAKRKWYIDSGWEKQYGDILSFRIIDISTPIKETNDNSDEGYITYCNEINFDASNCNKIYVLCYAHNSTMDIYKLLGIHTNYNDAKLQFDSKYFHETKYNTKYIIVEYLFDSASKLFMKDVEHSLMTIKNIDSENKGPLFKAEMKAQCINVLKYISEEHDRLINKMKYNRSQYEKFLAELYEYDN